MSFRTLSAIVRGPWAIDRNWAVANLPLIANLLNGGNVKFSQKLDGLAFDDDDDRGEREEKNKIVLIKDFAGGISAGKYRSFNDAPEGSIALIPVVGPIMKYGGDCGEPGSVHMNQWTEEAKASSRIAGAIFKFDTPGGQVDGTATFADTIKNFGKPNYGFIDDGMMASAGMWLGSACDEIYASQKTDQAGSIGVLTAFFDFIEYWKKEGIKYHEIYAPQSTDKNGDYRASRDDGNDEPIKEDLKFLAAQFISTIKTNRKGKLNLEFDNPFTGKMFYAKDAISVGLIDGIASMADLVDQLSSKPKKKNYNNNTANQNSNHTTMFGNKFTKLGSLKGLTAAQVTAEVLESVNEELVANGIEHATLVADADLDASIKSITDLKTANKKLTDDLAASNLSLQASEKKVEELGKLPGANKTNPKKTGADNLPSTEDFELTDVDKEARAIFAELNEVIPN